MATKLIQYIMSEKFQQACARAVVRAAEEARVSGLPPAGDQVSVPLSKPCVTVVFPPQARKQGIGFSQAKLHPRRYICDALLVATPEHNGQRDVFTEGARRAGQRSNLQPDDRRGFGEGNLPPGTGTA